MTTIVLGGGPSALAYLFYNASATALVGPSLGGQFANSKNLGPQLLWYSDETKSLLESLKLSTETRKTDVGYYFNGVLRHGSELGAGLRHAQSQYAMKTRGTEPKSTFLSEGKTSYDVFTVTVEEMVRALVEVTAPRCVHALATHVDHDGKTVTGSDGKYYSCDQLVSTIPAPIFLKMVNPEHPAISSLRSFDKMYVRASGHQAEPWMREARERGYDYVYVPGSDRAYHRVKVSGEEVILEYTMKESGVRLQGNGIVYQPGGQIVGGHEELAAAVPVNVKLLGRYAEWRHGIKFHDVLKKIVSERCAA